MVNRRRFVAAGSSLAALCLAGRTPRAVAQAAGVLRSALQGSDLVYLSPLRSDGRLSQCQAEIWFAYVDDALYVVTASDAWRAQAIDRGLSRTQVWVGDVGRWASSDGAYRDLPQLQADGSYVRDAVTQGRVLDVMGGKYRADWSVWGPRYNRELAKGSRVMLRYQPAPATSGEVA